jgi:hypothetical protein
MIQRFMPLTVYARVDKLRFHYLKEVAATLTEPLPADRESMTGRHRLPVTYPEGNS